MLLNVVAALKKRYSFYNFNMEMLKVHGKCVLLEDFNGQDSDGYEGVHGRFRCGQKMLMERK